MTEIEFGRNRYHEIGDMIDWCREHIGPGSYLGKPSDVWSIQQAFGNTYFSFKKSADATLFALRWQ